MTLTPTEIESLRIAIAEECGWKIHEGNRFLVIPPKSPHSVQGISTLPPYTTSLDAIQAAAMERFVDSFNKGDFEVNLTLAANECSCIWQLTPIDWCIAFARTAKIWNYKPLNETNPPRV